MGCRFLFSFLFALAHIGQHFHRCRVVMGENKLSPSSKSAMAPISSALRVKSKTSRFCSIRSFMNRFGNHHYIILGANNAKPLGPRFCRISYRSPSKLHWRRNLSDLRQGSPGFMLYTILFHNLMGLFLLLKYVSFHLIHSRCDLYELARSMRRSG